MVNKVQFQTEDYQRHQPYLYPSCQGAVVFGLSVSVRGSVFRTPQCFSVKSLKTAQNHELRFLERYKS